MNSTTSCTFKEINNFHAVVDEPYGLDETTGQIIKDILGNTLFDLQSETYAGQSWTQMREANIGSSTSRLNTTTVLSQAVTPE